MSRYEEEYEDEEDDYEEEKLERRSEYRRRKSKAKKIIHSPAQTLFAMSIISIVVTSIGLVLDFVLLAVIIPRLGQEANPAGMNGKAFVRIVWSIIMLVSNCLTLYGSTKMKSMESQAWSYVACITTLLIPFGPCCILGAPVGVWGLIVMHDRRVLKYFG
ncbi:MAG: hypothetical protein U0798_03630 [Gemmataceae bacterium]